jgi:hypothetical protein
MPQIIKIRIKKPKVHPYNNRHQRQFQLVLYPVIIINKKLFFRFIEKLMYLIYNINYIVVIIFLIK